VPALLVFPLRPPLGTALSTKFDLHVKKISFGFLDYVQVLAIKHKQAATNQDEAWHK
jgi:hypothetical protein